MSLAIGLVELNSIARGIETCDTMVKAARVDLIRSSAICPGKYMILIGGDTGDVKTSVAEGVRCAGRNRVDDLILPNVHPSVLKAVKGEVCRDHIRALGVLEVRTVSAAVIAADVAVKEAGISLVRVRIGNGIGGKGYIILTGDTGEVKASAAAAETICADKLIHSVVIPHPSEALVQKL
jgi:microcompartment protein CcmL/EutN